LRKSKILLVDDSVDILQVVGWALEDRGYQVTKASGGMEAIERLAVENFDLVISDLMMHPVDGISVLKEAKARQPMARVIIFTAYDDLYTSIDARRQGADAYILKRSGLNEIMERIGDCLKRMKCEPCIA
jgi:DNA-binding response OmpR family regulator